MLKNFSHQKNHLPDLVRDWPKRVQNGGHPILSPGSEMVFQKGQVLTVKYRKSAQIGFLKKPKKRPKK